jgi:hypothetical protein
MTMGVTVAAWRGSRTVAYLLMTGAVWGLMGCGRPAGGGNTEGRPAPVYDPKTGRLKELVSDRNKDGKPDMWAYMDGAKIERIEIDRNGDGRIDRWEHYGPLPAGAAANTAPPLVRAEEANAGDDRVTRREFYVRGVVDRVEEDANGDGRLDKWEQYSGGTLARVDLDLQGKGFADRRLVYGPGGAVDAIEEDPDGDGRFVPVKPEAGRGR